nr:hypothetical protein [Tanacetum cinerariifolium]
NFPPVNRKFSTGDKKFPTVNKNFSTASRKFPTGSTKGPTIDMGMKGKVVKSSACWSWKPSQYLSNKGSSQRHIDDQGYWDSGCSRHMIGNISYLSDFEPFDRGYVSFGQGGCKITGKGTIKTESIVLGRDFKLLDDANILLRTPRQHNMYTIDLNNIVLHRDLTCLVAKASTDECNLWHRRLDDANILLRTPRQHNMYSIDLNNIVRHRDLTCLVAKASADECNLWHRRLGKQHKASCKSKLVTSLTKPLHTLHMDLFGPTSDETSSILRKFITKIENQKDLKVKIIRCDNGGSKESLSMLGLLSRMVWLKGEIDP